MNAQAALELHLRIKELGLGPVRDMPDEMAASLFLWRHRGGLMIVRDTEEGQDIVFQIKKPCPTDEP